MAIQLAKIGNSPNTPIKDYVCDLRIEIEKLPKVVMGSTCLCLEDKSVWVKGSDEWKEITSPTPSNKELKILEQLIDESGVLDNTEGTVTEKVEQLIGKASDESKWYEFIEKFDQNISYAFRDCTFESLPRMNPKNIPKTTFWFQNNKYLKYIDFYLNTESCTNFARMFSNASALERIVGINISKATAVAGMFYQCTSLHTIGEMVDGELINPLDFSNVTNNSQCFDGCDALVNVSFVEESIKNSLSIPSPILSAESVQSIIDGLATVETARTLTLHADVKAKLTEEQIATITGKNWNLA